MLGTPPTYSHQVKSGGWWLLEDHCNSKEDEEIDSSSELSLICGSCSIGGRCCRDARPPLTNKRTAALSAGGVSPEAIEFAGYSRLKVKDDGFCILFDGIGCTVHSIKPETCIAGPFTFDMVGDILQIYLKKETICPLVSYLKEDRRAYEDQYRVAVRNIIDLVRDLPAEELAIILKIEEPDTVKVAEIDLSGYRRKDRGWI